MKNTKAQVTTFIIIAVFIIAIAIGITFLKSNKQTDQVGTIMSKLGLEAQATVVENSIQDCLEETSENGIAVVGLQGGYYNKPEDSNKYYDMEWTFIPYYYDQGSFQQPSTSQIESEISAYVDENIETCLNQLEYNNFNLAFGTSNSNSQIKETKVEIQTDLTISISKDERTETLNLKNSPTEIVSPLFRILEVATFITESHREDPEMLCVSCVADMAEERNIYVDMTSFEDDPGSTLTIISENQTFSDTYVFEFLNRYPE